MTTPSHITTRMPPDSEQEVDFQVKLAKEGAFPTHWRSVNNRDMVLHALRSLVTAGNRNRHNRYLNYT